MLEHVMLQKHFILVKSSEAKYILNEEQRWIPYIVFEFLN